ncbi:MAG: DICT sensory domain-containing protein [Halobacteriaceae archaeon]
MSGPVERLEGVIRDSDTPERSLVVVNRTEADAVQGLLEGAFADQPVAVAEDRVPDGEENLVVLVRDGEVVATSPLSAVMNACLLVNSDLYRTGPSGIDRNRAPAVITRLDETVFDLRGYPASNSEKLLLVVVSRFIEGLALETGAGRLRSSFQRLSRIDRELGTRAVYDRLDDSGVAVHVYGADDWEPPADWELAVHTGDHEGYRRSWCVVFVPPGGRHAALIALERAPNEWRGMWTYDPAKVRRTDEIIAGEF